MNKMFEQLLDYLEIDIEFDMNIKIVDHDEYDSLMVLSLSTFLEKNLDLKLDDPEAFCEKNSFNDLKKIISG